MRAIKERVHRALLWVYGESKEHVDGKTEAQSNRIQMRADARIQAGAEGRFTINRSDAEDYASWMNLDEEEEAGGDDD